MKATANKSARTYTLRVDGNKYRTIKMSKEEFDNLPKGTKYIYNGTQYIKGQ